MIRISQMKLPVGHTREQLEKKIAKILKNPGCSFSYEIKKQSLDCRHKNDKIFVYTVDVKIRDEQKIARKVDNNNVMVTKEKYTSSQHLEISRCCICLLLSEADRQESSAAGIWPGQVIVL